MADVLPQVVPNSQLIITKEPPVHRRSRRKAFSASSITTYVGIFLLIVSLIAVSYRPAQTKSALASTSQLSGTAAAYTAAEGDVDQLLATSVGANLADSIDLPVANNVANLSQSLVAESALAQTDANMVSKPQNIQLGANSITLREYVAVAGDTVPSVAAKYGISAQTVRWANNLTSDALSAGKKLVILPVDGILYTVKAGDTIDSITSKYKADKDVIVHDNSLELSGVTVGQQLIIANGELPESERPGYVAPVSLSGYGNYTGGSSYASNIAASAGNRYAWGNCTWYAYERRTQLGLPVGSFWGNASTWSYSARASNYLVDNNPSAGAIMANGGGYGHVAIVESVDVGEYVRVSEMNAYRCGGGFNRISYCNIPWNEAVSGMYSYIH